MRSTSHGPGLLSLAALLFNRPARVVLSEFSRQCILLVNADSHSAALIKRDSSLYEDKCGNAPFLSTGSTLVV